ncbi:haloacid dehalogenase protein [Purpureocillium lavendulum]|uniref:Haloacid dehalogenase protein n=1 Tax=Purpureocillium lavendulum TaxID=1247861 RepID=A0AB34FY30_9HYPO|nr:haloacid dehalogenase protein [Purpureocillium lavendulum]
MSRRPVRDGGSESASGALGSSEAGVGAGQGNNLGGGHSQSIPGLTVHLVPMAPNNYDHGSGGIISLQLNFSLGAYNQASQSGQPQQPGGNRNQPQSNSPDMNRQQPVSGPVADCHDEERSPRDAQLHLSPEMDTPFPQRTCGACKTPGHVARQCIRVDNTCVLAACTICNSDDHLVDECKHWAALSLQDQIRVTVLERANLPELKYRRKFTPFGVLGRWCMTGSGMPDTMGWSTDFIDALRRDGCWLDIVSRYEGLFSFDSSLNPGDSVHARAVSEDLSAFLAVAHISFADI